MSNFEAEGVSVPRSAQGYFLKRTDKRQPFETFNNLPTILQLPSIPKGELSPGSLWMWSMPYERAKAFRFGRGHYGITSVRLQSIDKEHPYNSIKDSTPSETRRFYFPLSGRSWVGVYYGLCDPIAKYNINKSFLAQGELHQTLMRLVQGQEKLLLYVEAPEKKLIIPPAVSVPIGSSVFIDEYKDPQIRSAEIVNYLIIDTSKLKNNRFNHNRKHFTVFNAIERLGL